MVLKVNNPPSQRPRTSAKAYQSRERMARWITREYERRPTIGYNEMIEACAERFAVGAVTAQRAHARAKEMFADEMKQLDLSWVVHEYKRIYEIAVASGQLGQARKILDSLSINAGVAMPRSATLHVTGPVTADQIAHVNILKMTPAQARNRELELQAMEDGESDDDLGLGDSPPIDIDTGEPSALAIVPRVER